MYNKIIVVLIEVIIQSFRDQVGEASNEINHEHCNYDKSYDFIKKQEIELPQNLIDTEFLIILLALLDCILNNLFIHQFY